MSHKYTIAEINAAVTRYLSGRGDSKITEYLVDGIVVLEDVLDQTQDSVKAKVETFHAQNLAKRILGSLTMLLHQHDLLERYFAIYPDPGVFSQSILWAFSHNAKGVNFEVAAKALSLGGVITNEAVGHTALFKDQIKLPPPTIYIELFQNLKINWWATSSHDKEESNHSLNAFISDLLSLIALSKPAHVVDMLLDDPDFFDQFSTQGLYAAVSSQYGMLKTLIYQHCSTNLLLSIHNRSMETYTELLNDPCIMEAISSNVARRGVLNIGKIPAHPNINSKFCLDVFYRGMQNLTLNEDNYKGLQKHWAANGQTDKLHKKAVRRKYLKYAINAYHEYAQTISRIDFRVSMLDKNKIRLFMNNVELFEKIYIKPENRIAANPVSAQNHIICALHNVDEDRCKKICNTYEGEITSARVVDELVWIAATESQLMSRKADSIITAMIHDKEKRQAFSHISYQSYKDVFSGWNEQGKKLLRTVRWEDPEIRKSWISTDMDI